MHTPVICFSCIGTLLYNVLTHFTTKQTFSGVISCLDRHFNVNSIFGAVDILFSSKFQKCCKLFEATKYSLILHENVIKYVKQMRVNRKSVGVGVGVIETHLKSRCDHSRFVQFQLIKHCGPGKPQIIASQQIT